MSWPSRIGKSTAELVSALALALMIGGLGDAPAAFAHDIPNARVDRAAQAILEPGRLRIEYEVSLAELTLTQDLIALIGSLPGGDRASWFAKYGEVAGPLNAKGFLVEADGQEIAFSYDSCVLAVEEHPRYVFKFSASVPERGRLRIRDINYQSSEGTCKIALRASAGVAATGDGRPELVAEIAEKPKVLMDDDEERRSREIIVDYRPDSSAGVSRPDPQRQTSPQPRNGVASSPPSDRLARLLDRGIAGGSGGWIWLWLVALGLGMAHAIQPGHGKSLAAAAALRSRRAGLRLATAAALAHWATIVILAVGLWLTHSDRFETWNAALVQGAGLILALVGFWRLGRGLGGHETADHFHQERAGGDPNRVAAIGIAAGLIPCWDAVLLIVLALAFDQMTLGLFLLTGFCLGMGAVLLAAAWSAGALIRALPDGRRQSWRRWSGLASAIVLTLFGASLAFASP